jgi:hypothetical protein
MKSKNGVKIGIVVLVLLLAIGFAAVTTQLFINGTINIGPDTNDFNTNVTFYSATATGAAQQGVTGDVAASASLSNDKKTITFTTQILDTIGEESLLEYDVDNQSTYDALLGDMVCSLGNTFDAENASLTLNTEYVRITSNNELKNTVVASGTHTSTKGSVLVKQIKSYNGTTATNLQFTCRMNADAQEAA